MTDRASTVVNFGLVGVWALGLDVAFVSAATFVIGIVVSTPVVISFVLVVASLLFLLLRHEKSAPANKCESRIHNYEERINKRLRQQAMKS